MIYLYNKRKIVFFLSLILIMFSFSITSFAQTSSSENLFPCGNNFGNECTFDHLLMLVSAIVSRLFKYALILSSIVFAYAGFLYLTSQDNPGNRSKAKGIFINVAIGLAVMMGAWVIVNLVLTALVDDSFLSSSPFKTVKN